jgi:hypothetical protein
MCGLWPSSGIVDIAQVLSTYAPFMQAHFDSRALHAGDAVRIGLCGVGLFLLLEAEKVLARQLGWLGSPV